MEGSNDVLQFMRMNPVQSPRVPPLIKDAQRPADAFGIRPGTEEVGNDSKPFAHERP